MTECKLLRSCPSLFMFMFRSRRNALVKRLWRLAAEAASGDAGEDETGDAKVKPAVHALFKRLSDDQLALLVDCLDSGASASPCLWLDSDLVNSEYLSLVLLVLFSPCIQMTNQIFFFLSFSFLCSNRDKPGRRPPAVVPHLPLAGSPRPGGVEAHRQLVHRAAQFFSHRLLQSAPLVAPIT